MAESPIPIEYYILVYRGDPSVIEPTRVFKYHDHAPASVCVSYGIGAPHTPELNGALDKLSQVLAKDRYNVVGAVYAWRCVFCDKPARAFTSNGISRLSDCTGGMIPGFKPSMIDIAIPICTSEGPCNTKALGLVQADTVVNKWLALGADWKGQITRPPFCEQCGKGSGLKPCSGCKVAGYCSKECQAKAWPLHKIYCKRAQREYTDAELMASISR